MQNNKILKTLFQKRLGNNYVILKTLVQERLGNNYVISTITNSGKVKQHSVCGSIWR